MKRIIGITLLSLLTAVGVAQAKGAFWTYQPALYKATNIAILPVQGAQDYIDGDLFLSQNLAKRDKMVDYFNVDYVYANSEKERAQIIANKYQADAYIIPRIRKFGEREDWAPGKSLTYNYRTYTEVNGPQGRKVYDETSREYSYYVDGQPVYMAQLILECTMYNSDGSPIVTFLDREYKKGKYENQLENKILKEFSVMYRDALKPYKNDLPLAVNPVYASSVTSDKYVLNGMNYVLLNGSRKLKKVPAMDNYYVDTVVSEYREKFNYHDPSLMVRDRELAKYTDRYKDRDGKEQKITTTYYDTEVYDIIPGYYTCSGVATATLRLVDKRTGQAVYRYSKTEEHVKEIDSFRDIVDDFYKGVNKFFNSKK